MHEQIQQLYLEIVETIPFLSDSTYCLSQQNIDFLRSNSQANNHTTALYQPATDSYTFLYIRNPDFRYFHPEEVRFYDFMRHMHSDDYLHYFTACKLAHQFIKKTKTEELKHYSLVFECRMQDQNKTYRRILFRYKLMLLPENQQGVLLLLLNEVDGCKADSLYRGICMVDEFRKGYIPLHAIGKISARKIEILQHTKEGRTCEEISEILSRSHKTIRNHRCTTVAMMGLKDCEFAYFYMKKMGILL